jgi:hypothetical protein
MQQWKRLLQKLPASLLKSYDTEQYIRWTQNNPNVHYGCTIGLSPYTTEPYPQQISPTGLLSRPVAAAL